MLGAVLALAVAAGCGEPSGTPGGSAESRPAAGRPAPPAPPPTSAAASRPAGRTFALLINGGGKPEKNYRSHLLHVRELADLLVDHGVPRERIAAFVSDGDDPAPDLALRDSPPAEDFWLVEATPLGRALRGALRFEDSRLEGLRLRPATRGALDHWFEREGRRLEPGDTLLVYVTDHGTRNARDLQDNRIVLWGESLSVIQLRALLARLEPGVRVVALMSQCYSGSFAHASWPRGGVPRRLGDRCGFYASSAERPAYGCYAENRDVDNVGHSFRFFEALRAGLSFLDAHEYVVLADRTPDVPNRTSDHWLRDQLAVEARRRGQTQDALVEELLREVWRDPAQFAPELARLERMAQVFGSFPPRSLAELDEQAREIPAFGEEFDVYAGRWQQLLNEQQQRNLSHFLQVLPDWRSRLDWNALRALEPGERARLLDQLLPELAAVTRSEPARLARLEDLRALTRAAREAGYRMEVRRAALLRMRLLLERIAGLVWIARSGDVERQRELAALEACESFALGEPPPFAAAELPLPPPFPPLQTELATLDAVLPGWIGLEYARLDARERSALGPGLPAGAVRVERVLPGSPAERAGLRPGDVVLGPPGAPFDEPNRIREWIMTAGRSEVRPLEILRDGEPWVVEVVIGAPPL